MSSEGSPALPSTEATTPAANSESGYTPRYIDVGINLTDPVFSGVYHGKHAHENDFEDVLQRAKAANCLKLMVTGSDLHESRQALKLAEKHPGYIFSTAGVHPCSAKEFDQHKYGGPDVYLSELRALAISGKESGHLAAFGEIGLDYDRLFLSPKEQQIKYFDLQLDLAEEIGLPLFLHSRAATEDFESMLFPRLPKLKGGLVHSFTGTMDEMKRLVEKGLYIGVNGCSLKTEENLQVVKEVPLDRLMLETDGPWCEIRPSHASSKYLKDNAPILPQALKKERFKKGSMVKGRNEPCTISHVATVVARLKGLTVEEVCEAAWKNTIGLFGLGENGVEGK
ncbi:hypothetical protein RUND412_001058 [Rhizina undulata]